LIRIVIGLLLIMGIASIKKDFISDFDTTKESTA